MKLKKNRKHLPDVGKVHAKVHIRVKKAFATGKAKKSPTC